MIVGWEGHWGARARGGSAVRVAAVLHALDSDSATVVVNIVENAVRSDA